MNQQFMKEKKIVPLVLQMSVPMILSMAVNALYNIVDSRKRDEDTTSRIAANP